MIHWNFWTFNQLNTTQLYEIIRARELVFVQEQKICYVDCDFLDFKAYHLIGYQDSDLAAYTRVFEPNVKFPDHACFGRVLTTPKFRGQGLGKKLIQEVCRRINENFSNPPIKISAQEYLQTFYESFGFQKIGNSYIEEGIPHILMVRGKN